MWILQFDWLILIHLKQHWLISVDTIFRSLCFMSWFLWWGLLFTRKLLNQGLLLVKLKSSIRIFYGRHHDLVDCYGISVSQMTTDMFYLSYALSGLFLIHDISLTRLTWRVSLVEQELLSLPDHLSSSPVFGGVRVNPSLVLCVCFLDRCLSFYPFSVDFTDNNCFTHGSRL